MSKTPARSATPPRDPAASSPTSQNARALKVAHVLSSLGMGGQERIALDLAARQAEAGHDVVVISLDARPRGPLAADFEASGIEVAHAPKTRRFDLPLATSLAALLRRRHVDIVHTHNPLPLIYAAPAARLSGAAVVHTKHGMNPASGRQIWLRRRAASLARAFVAVSDHTATVAHEAGESPPGRLYVVPNGIELSRFGAHAGGRDGVRAELGVPEGAHLLGTVGRLFTEKGHDFLLRAVEPLLSDELHLAIIGDGPEARALADRTGELRRGDAVHLLGPRQDVPRLLCALDAFVLPSVREGLPLVVPEAMASSLPVIATAVGGLPTVVEDDRTGFLVEYGDEAALRARIAALAADPGLCRRLGERGRERALAEFSVETMLARYMTIYRAVLPDSPR